MFNPSQNRKETRDSNNAEIQKYNFRRKVQKKMKIQVFMLFLLIKYLHTALDTPVLSENTNLSRSARETQHRRLSKTCLTLHKTEKKQEIRTTLRSKNTIFTKSSKKNGNPD